MSVAQPPLVGATKTSGVVLQLQQVQSVAGEDERYQGEVMRLAPAPKFSPRQAARGE